MKTLLIAAASDDPAIDHAFALGGQPGLSDLAHGIAAHRTIHPSAENRHLAILPARDRPREHAGVAGAS